MVFINIICFDIIILIDFGCYEVEDQEEIILIQIYSTINHKTTIIFFCIHLMCLYLIVIIRYL